MPASDIIIKGAREHNLQDVDLILPRNQLICLTGVSGSGKSSLAFDTVYAEGQRRYVESLSSFARQFLGQMPKPDVDLISGLSPSISISQKSTGNNPRSTVGTITEIYDYLRVLYARVGRGFCYQCGGEITAQTRDQIIARILQLESGTPFSILAPLIRGQKGEHRDLFEDLLKQGFVRARVDGDIVSLSGEITLDRRMRHDIEVVVDRLEVKGNIRSRVSEGVELALKKGDGALIIELHDAMPSRKSDAELESDSTTAPKAKNNDLIFSADYACIPCGISFNPPTPQLFSFNSPQGMCQECDGLGQIYSFDPQLLISKGANSFKKGCFELLDNWKGLGRWRRHIYQGVADTIERIHGFEEGTMLETPWQELSEKQQELWLWGTGETHITFTWRGGSAPMKYGGKFEGIIPDLEEKYRSTKSKPQQRQLEQYMNTLPCGVCKGKRLNQQASSIKTTTSHADFQENATLSLPDVCDLSIEQAEKFFHHLELDETRTLIATEALKEIRARLGFLLNVGLDYLTLNRTAPTLSGGETQRIRLAGQIGSGLVGVLYILDEPSIGLHPRDNERLLSSLCRLRDLGNTVVVVEHDEDTMLAADQIIDFGPGPGVRGGEVVAQGAPEEVLKSKKSLTGQYLSGAKKIEIPQKRRPPNDNKIVVRGARHNNLKNVDVEIPTGCFVCVTGVSGSGKSSLVNDILVESLRRDLNRGLGEPGDHDDLTGLEHLDKLIAIDQTPIGRTPRSNPGTYIKVFDDIRHLFCQMLEAKQRGYKPGRFSFNVKEGRCEACEGNGSNKLEMDFLADVWVTCPVCEGHRFNRETLQVKFKGYSIAEVLEMDIQQAMDLFDNIPKIKHKLQTLHDVGLDYLKIGQPSPTLSGGEAQRIKLAKELVKKSTGKTLYLLDEPTTGLHFHDIHLLLKVLQEFVNSGNTVLVVEHNLDVIKTADWIIDIGPEGGAGGGQVVGCGTPEEIAKKRNSHTGKALKKVFQRHEMLSNNGAAAITSKPKIKKQRGAKVATHINVQGASQHNLRSVDVKVQRDKMTVFCGPSGSGKSSLAMDTIYAEGQRRYVESLSSYARQFVNQMQKPRLDHIDGLSPAIAIEQKNLGSTPRSTVGTATEIYDYLRIMMARLGSPYCPDCNQPIGTQTSDEITDKLMNLETGTRVYLSAPLEVAANGDYPALWEEVRSAGFIRVRIDGFTYPIDELPKIDRRRKHDVEVVVDRTIIKQSARSRIAESVEVALSLGQGMLHVTPVLEGTDEVKWETTRHSQHLACDCCGRSFEPLTPHNFSFNSKLGWCSNCEGIGTQIGANPAALLKDPQLTLAEGAVSLWPNLKHKISQLMLESLSRETGIPLDVPFEELNSRWRRIILHGSGEQWIDVLQKKRFLFRYQFKGLYPALEEASKVSPKFRQRLEQFVDEVECSACGGSRLRDDASAVQYRGNSIDDLCRMTLENLHETVNAWKFDRREQKIAGELLREVQNRVQFLLNVGLNYLSLNRTAASLSNGEAQRIRLASQLGSGLCGVLYVLDEPTIGLHPRDNRRLLGALHNLRDLGNTLLVVEHDREVIESSDFVCDFGPRAGRNGGQVVAHGTPEQVMKRRASVTGPYLSGKKNIPIPIPRRPVFLEEEHSVKAPKKGTKKKTTARPAESKISRSITLDVIGARHNNLKNIDVSFPLETLTVVTGPSGCGKSSLVEEILFNSLSRKLHHASTVPGAHDEIRGLSHINKVIRVDQKPLGNTPTSNPATYTGVFELIRTMFAQLPDAKLRGYTPRRFSFNVPGGRCEDCEGNGQKRIEMHFLPDVWVECETCGGHRYNEETLAVKFHDHSISDVLNMTCQQGVELFENIPKIRRILQTLCDVGLDYLNLGQSAPTLSGGEAQRVKLASELARPDTGRTLYLLDEPTTGLHFDDLKKLLDVLHRLVDMGNTVVLIEHNLDVIKQADWIIDMGPEAGVDGGKVVTAGTPESVVEYAREAMKSKSKSKSKSDGKDKKARSHTGEALIEYLCEKDYRNRKTHDFDKENESRDDDMDIVEVGDTTKMPWESNGRKWHTKDRVGRKGEAVRWEGEILSRVVDYIQDRGEFNETDFSNRTVVEITGAKKSAGWFFHAITAETWLLKMKFRVRRGCFNRKTLQESMPLKSLNQLDELPIYGNDPRVKCKNTRGPWQEVEIRVHSLQEIDTPEFWSFLDEAVIGFFDQTGRTAEDIESQMPWKKLGQKWHFLRKGFSPGKKVEWDVDVLEELVEILNEVVPEGQFLWNNQVLVHMLVPGQKEPWATLLTKKYDALHLTLTGPKDSVSLGEMTQLAHNRWLDGTKKDKDQVRMEFKSIDDVHRGDLVSFLKKHCQSINNSPV